MKQTNGRVPTLLDLAIVAERELDGSERPPADEEHIRQVELALAYHAGIVHCGAVAKVLGFNKTSQVSAWFSSIIMKAIRNGTVVVSLNKNLTVSLTDTASIAESKGVA